INNEVSYRLLHNVSFEGRKHASCSSSVVLNAPCYYNEALASPEQTATGKDFSNPFMAGSLPTTTLCVIL
ncbi:hypothetical protein Tco_0100448, partial [Tanacetum coccineum]